MPGTVSLGRTLVFATLFHAGLFAIVGRPRAPGSEARPVEPMKLVSVEGTQEVEPPAPPPVQEADESTPDRSATTVAASTRVVASTPHVVSPVGPPDTAPSASGGWTLNVTSGHGTSAPSPPTLADLGLDGKNHFLGGRGQEPEPAPDPARAENERANRAAGGAMRQALHDQDIGMGLGGGGPVVTALEEAVLAGTAPLESHAVLVAIADAAGVVTSVDVESYSDDLSSFRAIAEDVLHRLRDKRVRMPAATNGISMRIEVTSRLAAPSGGGSGLDPRHAGINFDVSDIGAHVARIVHARILGERLL
jgi:hypothetical protein